MMVRGIGVMRRRSDSWINATQILKVAGIEKGKRTKILDKDIAASAEPNKIPFEKIQGGYGRYQGTWIPFHHAKALAEQYNVVHLLQPLLDYHPAPSPAGPLGGLGQISPSTTTSALADLSGLPSTSNTLGNPSGQAQIANPQQQRLQQQQQLSQAQQVPLPSPTMLSVRTNGIADAPQEGNPSSGGGGTNGSSSGTNATSIAAPPAEKASPRKRGRRPTVDKGPTNTDSPEKVGNATKRARTNTGTSTSLGTAADDQEQMLTTQQQPHTGATGYTPQQQQQQSSQYQPMLVDPQRSPELIRIRKSNKHDEAFDINLEHRNALMSFFIHDSPAASTSSSAGHNAPRPLTTDPMEMTAMLPVDLDPNTPIDDQHHTALHWAAALAKIRTVKALIHNLYADPNQGNLNGETPLMRAILVTNNFDIESFYHPSSSAANGPAGTDTIDDDSEGLLNLLSSSIMTVDDADRSVLHHISLVAGIKGRSSSARHYLESILQYLTDRVESGQLSQDDFLKFINLQDGNGDTALNISARIGNKFLVKIFLAAGADWKIPNKLGLRPGDFGLLDSPQRSGPDSEPTSLPLIPSMTAEELAVERVSKSSIAAQTTGTSTGTDAADASTVPLTSEQQSAELLNSFTSLLSSLASDFKAEIQSRSDSLARTKNQLHLATKELAEQRATISSLKEQAKTLELTRFRIKNLERALAEEDSFDWTGRTGLDGQPAFPPSNAGEGETPADRAPRSDQPDEDEISKAAFEYRGPNSTLGALPAVNMPTNIDPDPPLPSPLIGSSGGDGKASTPPASPPPSMLTLSQLRRMVIWYSRVLSLMRHRIDDLQRNNVDSEGHVLNELEMKKLIRLCTGLGADEDIDDALESLITALESDGSQSSGLDLQRLVVKSSVLRRRPIRDHTDTTLTCLPHRVSNFMAKVRSQELV